jgi:hypothetical protein
MAPRTLDAYRALPYERVWETRDEDGRRSFVVRLAEIPCVVGGGASKDTAFRALLEAFDDYLEWRLDEGLPIAEPRRVVPREAGRQLKVTIPPTQVDAQEYAGSAVTPDPSRETRADADTRIYRYPALAVA